TGELNLVGVVAHALHAKTHHQNKARRHRNRREELALGVLAKLGIKRNRDRGADKEHEARYEVNRTELGDLDQGIDLIERITWKLQRRGDGKVIAQLFGAHPNQR